MKQIDEDTFEMTGAELLATALDYWRAFGSDQPFADWFKESQYILADKVYQCDAMLADISEVRNETRD
ncbi:hypothetical protein [Lacticaseibacillus rhamnosus]|uniref:hypothetical protein n=1 Tax=Lacticaseibacillus rhamnosus TaxID=47715 RepID=UPI0007E27985|nr:hypothetical protein [Lacticaseibacillus rhamnosus]OAU25328.1 hypothetical protein PY91_03125 [Lacticaseibacillus rhamnosus]